MLLFSMSILFLSTLIAAGASIFDSPSVFVLIAVTSRLLQGIGAAANFNVVFAIIADKYPDSKVVYAGYVTLLDNFGFAIGPILSAILFESLGYAYTNIVSSGVVLILGLIPAMIVP
jgi:MFS family permease